MDRSIVLPKGNREMKEAPRVPASDSFCCLLAARTILAVGDATPAAFLEAVGAQNSR